jgi:hypothetical protein
MSTRRGSPTATNRHDAYGRLFDDHLARLPGTPRARWIGVGIEVFLVSVAAESRAAREPGWRSAG